YRFLSYLFQATDSLNKMASTSLSASFQIRFSASSLISPHDLCHLSPHANGWKSSHTTESYKLGRTIQRSLRGSSVVSPMALAALEFRNRINDLAEKQYGKFATGDTKANSWTLLDFGDVVVHIFLPEQREIYNLEEFYANATPIELPFENEQRFGR
ncbi:hypothetical protein M8C21_013148, partial [Ambrosia artemisiifolia]